MSHQLLLKKTADDPELRIVWAEVFAPDRPDAAGDFMTPETIREMAYEFMRKQELGNVDQMHDNKTTEGVQIIESFIVRKGDPDFIEGAWVVAVHVDDDETWEKVKKGELNGFSLEALAMTEELEVEIEIPPVVTGKTSKSEDHEHTFFVTYDDQGEFKGGQTDKAADGHFHVIRAGTVTDGAKTSVAKDEHTHRFSSVDNLRVVR